MLSPPSSAAAAGTVLGCPEKTVLSLGAKLAVVNYVVSWAA